ncbi:MAG: hypothetical protein HN535_05300, partial [Flavobacteriales bacterium]|nr:hypothetical protein [Flavobacteriales bacterium]
QLFEKEKLESILYSLVTSATVARKTNGDQFVLQAVTGMENSFKALKMGDYKKAAELGIDLDSLGVEPLKFYRKEPRDSEGNLIQNPTAEQLADSTTLSMQVLLPHRFKELGMGTTINTTDDNIDPELLKLIGFRIPTEGLNSIESIEIAGFLPPSFGSTVIVPSEMVGKAGSDYDIDKITIYMPNYFYNAEENKVAKLPYLTAENSIVEDRLNLFEHFEYAEYKKLQKEVLSEYEEENGNNLLEEYISEKDAIHAEYEALNDAWDESTEEERKYIREEHKELTKRRKVLEGKFSVIQEGILRVFSQRTIENQNSTKAIQNRIIETMSDVITHPQNFGK